MAAALAHAECLHELLSCDVNINLGATADKRTPLHVATARGHNACIEVLLDIDFDTDATLPDAAGRSLSSFFPFLALPRALSQKCFRSVRAPLSNDSAHKNSQHGLDDGGGARRH